ncbi:MAG TPA: PQQ-dependent sugar dehydrogenase [Actinomycetota bacterium]|nr:PQQ-dependent sugar dehydrogenase [Actinomycetota bacterium]
MRRLLILPILLALLLVPDQAHAAVVAQLVAGGLNNPSSFTFTPNGKIVYGERLIGEIHLFDPATQADTLIYTVTNVSTQGEQGLLGLAIDPQFLSGQPFGYAYATRNNGGQLQNQILKIRYRPGQPPTSSVIFTSDTTAGTYHDGGRILFGPDGMLYAVIGESHTSANAQNLDLTAGKIVRMTRNGTAPSDNPFVGIAGDDLVWSYGHRNSYGFTFDPITGALVETENGPECNDELNPIVKGGNYAWGPNETCFGTAPQNTNQDGPNRRLPIRWYTPTIAPTGAAFCVGCGLTGKEGHFLFGDNNFGRIHDIVLTADRMGFVSEGPILYTHPRAVYSVERGPGGVIYFSEPTGIYKLVQQ